MHFMNDKHIKFLIEEDQEPERLDKMLALLMDDRMTRTQVKRHIQLKAVTLNGKVMTSPSHKIAPLDEIELTYLEAEETHLIPEKMPLDIIYEDEHLLVINKPAGMVVHPGAGNSRGTLVHGLLAHCGDQLSGIGGEKRPGIVHRLDKDTSGLMVVAKTDPAHQGLMQQFQSRTLSRHYIAYVMGCPNPLEGTIEGNIGRGGPNRQKMIVRKMGGKPAITHYKTIKTYIPEKSARPFATKIECWLETGRTHQIRVHMTHKGYPLLGDPLYGSTQSNKVMQRLMESEQASSWTHARQALHAQSLRFIHPISGEEVMYEAPMPDDMNALENLLLAEL